MAASSAAPEEALGHERHDEVVRAPNERYSHLVGVIFGYAYATLDAFAVVTSQNTVE